MSNQTECKSLCDEACAWLRKQLQRPNFRDTILIFASALAVCGYLGGIFIIGCNDVGCKTRPIATGNHIEYLQAAILSISTALATFVGSVLGMTTRSDSGSGAQSANDPANPTVTFWQFLAAIAYVLSLGAVVVIYLRQQGNSSPTIVSLAQSSIGFFGGALAVGLRSRNA